MRGGRPEARIEFNGCTTDRFMTDPRVFPPPPPPCCMDCWPSATMLLYVCDGINGDSSFLSHCFSSSRGHAGH